MPAQAPMANGFSAPLKALQGKSHSFLSFIISFHKILYGFDIYIDTEHLFWSSHSFELQI